MTANTALDYPAGTRVYRRDQLPWALDVPGATGIITASETGPCGIVFHVLTTTALTIPPSGTNPFGTVLRMDHADLAAAYPLVPDPRLLDDLDRHNPHRDLTEAQRDQAASYLTAHRDECVTARWSARQATAWHDVLLARTDTELWIAYLQARTQHAYAQRHGAHRAGRRAS
ncbi:hypothetical protein ACFC1T_08815 [Kitasatospora sp. NPDC056076]|uniref:hypothetical protein n=1 Tax=Kitasatospora sp. NPDC056076 TaxID=3345703 RepID=UPI0035DC9BB8